MREIIDGKVYDPRASEELTSYANKLSDEHDAMVGKRYQDLHAINESLYKTEQGDYFLYGWGGAETRYARTLPLGGVAGGTGLVPLTPAEARTWCEENRKWDALKKYFTGGNE